MAKTRNARHLGFYVSAIASVAAGLLTVLVDSSISILVGVNVFFLAYLGFTGFAVRKLSPEFLRKHADEEDAPAPLILLVMVAAVVVSAVSLFLVIADAPRAPGSLTLGIASVVLGWFAIHTMWAMHYAYEYYGVAQASKGDADAPLEGGLDFPGDDEPDGTAFLYFAYVIGMTAQTSDTAVTSNHMRRLVTIQGAFAFFFNTVLVAAAVNIVVSLAN
ncbi:MAG: DUF1345 domain-containing protein [Devosia sp.]